MNIYPEDLERALRQQEGVRDSVVLGIERDGNAEPCAVLLLDDPGGIPAPIVAEANKKLADFQKVSRSVVWPDADFPRTPTQKPILPRIRAALEAKFGGETRRREKIHWLTLWPVSRAWSRLASRRRSARRRSEYELSGSGRADERAGRALSSGLERSEVFGCDYNCVSWKNCFGILPRRRSSLNIRVGHRIGSLQRCAFVSITSGLARYVHPGCAANSRARKSARIQRSCALRFEPRHLSRHRLGPGRTAGRFRARLATAMRGERIVTMLRPPPEMNMLTLERALELFSGLRAFQCLSIAEGIGISAKFFPSREIWLADPRVEYPDFPGGKTTQDGRIVPFAPESVFSREQLRISRRPNQNRRTL